jgi:Family of unknown function (DUF5996)
LPSIVEDYDGARQLANVLSDANVPARALVRNPRQKQELTGITWTTRIRSSAAFIVKSRKSWGNQRWNGRFARLGWFLLPYDVVRLSENPDALLLDFLQSTYEAAASLGKWDREGLERRSTEKSWRA